jgi:hypothetical protein
LGVLPLSFEERPRRWHPVDRLELTVADDHPLDHDPAASSAAQAQVVSIPPGAPERLRLQDDLVSTSISRLHLSRILAALAIVALLASSPSGGTRQSSPRLRPQLALPPGSKPNSGPSDPQRLLAFARSSDGRGHDANDLLIVWRPDVPEGQIRGRRPPTRRASCPLELSGPSLTRTTGSPGRLAARSAAIQSAPACQYVASRAMARPAASISHASHHRLAVDSSIPWSIRE